MESIRQFQERKIEEWFSLTYNDTNARLKMRRVFEILDEAEMEIEEKYYEKSLEERYRSADR